MFTIPSPFQIEALQIKLQLVEVEKAAKLELENAKAKLAKKDPDEKAKVFCCLLILHLLLHQSSFSTIRDY